MGTSVAPPSRAGGATESWEPYFSYVFLYGCGAGPAGKKCKGSEPSAGGGHPGNSDVYVVFRAERSQVGGGPRGSG